MMTKAAIWIAARMVANRPSTVAVKPTRFFRKAIAGSTDDGPGIPQLVALFRLPWKIELAWLDRLARLYVRHFRRELIREHQYLKMAARCSLLATESS
jgi:hypothetical protein